MATTKRGIPPEHLALIWQIAKGVAKRVYFRVSVEDLAAEGAMGYLQAIKSYDPDKGTSLKSHIYQRIQGAMLDFLRKVDVFSQPDRRMKKRLDAADYELSFLFGRRVTDAELASNLEIDELTVARLRNQPKLVSMDSDGNESVRRAVARKMGMTDPLEAGMPLTLLAEITAEAQSHLNNKEAAVLEACLCGLTQAEIAPRLGITEARVSQIIEKLLVKLRRAHARINRPKFQPPAQRPTLIPPVPRPLKILPRFVSPKKSPPQPPPERKPISWYIKLSRELVLEAVCEYYGVEADELMGNSRDSYVVVARKVLMYLLCDQTRYLQWSIGRFVGKRSQTAVSQAYRWVRQNSADLELRADLHELRCLLEEKRLARTEEVDNDDLE